MKKIVLLVLALLASQANAGIVSADFVTRADNLALGGPVRELSAPGRSVGAGLEVGENALDTSPLAWDEGVLGGLVYLDLDPAAYRLTLSSLEYWEFDLVTARIGNIQFSGAQRITGLSLLSNSLAERWDSTAAIVPTWSFTDNGLEISYSTDEFFYLMAGGEAVFQILTDGTAPGGAVAEPASLGLLGLGLAGLMATRRRLRG